jgi:hypothetical protein
MQAKVVKTGPAICVGLLELDERVAAHLNIRERGPATVIANCKRLAKSHFLGVERKGFVEILDSDSHMIHIILAGEPRFLGLT